MIQSINIEGVRPPYSVLITYDNGRQKNRIFYSMDDALNYSNEQSERQRLYAGYMDTSIGDYNKVEDFKLKGR